MDKNGCNMIEVNKNANKMSQINRKGGFLSYTNTTTIIRSGELSTTTEQSISHVSSPSTTAQGIKSLQLREMYVFVFFYTILFYLFCFY